MALQATLRLKEYFLEGEIVRENCYVVIVNITGSKTLFVRYIYKDKKEGTTLHDEQFEFTPDVEGINYHAQAYEHMKTMPEFVDAIDC